VETHNYASPQKDISPQKGISLAVLYDPNTMPPKLIKAHNDLDKTVDQCYRKAPFETESKRMEFLFELYEKLSES